MTESWFYNFFLYFYALSSLFAVAYFFQPKPRARRYLVRFTSVLWALQTLVILVGSSGWWPKIEVESFFLYSWALLSCALGFLLLAKFDFLLIYANLFGLVVLISNRFFQNTAVEQLMLSKWIFFHVIVAMIAYAALSLSSLSSGAYLLTNYTLKQKKGFHRLRLLPSLDQLATLSKRLLQIGVIGLMVSICQGLVLAFHRWQTWVFLDPKTIGSFVILALYAMILYLENNGSLSKRKWAWWNLSAILLVFANYFLLNASFSFHYWIER
jgi:HemX protein